MTIHSRSAPITEPAPAVQTWPPDLSHQPEGRHWFPLRVGTRQGVTWETLAVEHGIPAHELIAANCGGQLEPHHVNWFLKHKVGCVKTDESVSNFVFEDADPGVIWVPESPRCELPDSPILENEKTRKAVTSCEQEVSFSIPREGGWKVGPFKVQVVLKGKVTLNRGDTPLTTALSVSAREMGLEFESQVNNWLKIGMSSSAEVKPTKILECAEERGIARPGGKGGREDLVRCLVPGGEILALKVDAERFLTEVCGLDVDSDWIDVGVDFAMNATFNPDEIFSVKVNVSTDSNRSVDIDVAKTFPGLASRWPEGLASPGVLKYTGSLAFVGRFALPRHPWVWYAAGGLAATYGLIRLYQGMQMSPQERQDINLRNWFISGYVNTVFVPYAVHAGSYGHLSDNVPIAPDGTDSYRRAMHAGCDDAIRDAIESFAPDPDTCRGSYAIRQALTQYRNWLVATHGDYERARLGLGRILEKSLSGEPAGPDAEWDPDSWEPEPFLRELENLRKTFDEEALVERRGERPLDSELCVATEEAVSPREDESNG